MPLINYVKKVFGEFGNDKGSQLSAAFAYSAVFALAPLLLVLVSVAGLIFGQRAVEGKLFGQIQDVVGPSAAHTIEHALAHTQKSGHSILALVIGLIGSLLAAGALTNQLQAAFNTVFAVIPDPKGGIRRTVYVKLKNAALVIIGSLIIAASIAFTALLTSIGKNIVSGTGLPGFVLEIINLLVSFIIFVGILYLLYRVLPDVRYPKKIVFWAALTIAVMFLIGKVILGWVIGRNGTASAYGAAASLITLLLWFYYTGQILILGAEGIKVYSNNRDIIGRPKIFTLKQKTVNIQVKGNMHGRMVEKFAHGFTGAVRGEKK